MSDGQNKKKTVNTSTVDKSGMASTCGPMHLCGLNRTEQIKAT